MMLYGASTMGSCYLIASMCLRVAQKDESKEAIVSFTTSLRPFFPLPARSLRLTHE